jgi:hypothetical protein
MAVFASSSDSDWLRYARRIRVEHELPARHRACNGEGYARVSLRESRRQAQGHRPEGEAARGRVAGRALAPAAAALHEVPSGSGARDRCSLAATTCMSCARRPRCATRCSTSCAKRTPRQNPGCALNQRSSRGRCWGQRRIELRDGDGNAERPPRDGPLSSLPTIGAAGPNPRAAAHTARGRARQNGRNASRSSAASWCDASPSASPSARNVARRDDPPVESNGNVNPVIGKTPRFTETLMKRCAPK